MSGNCIKENSVLLEKVLIEAARIITGLKVKCSKSILCSDLLFYNTAKVSYVHSYIRASKPFRLSNKKNCASSYLIIIVYCHLFHSTLLNDLVYPFKCAGSWILHSYVCMSLSINKGGGFENIGMNTYTLTNKLFYNLSMEKARLYF